MWLTWQGTFEASTCGGADASLLVQKLDGRLASADSLRTVTRVRLDAIPSTEKAIYDLGMFACVASHLFPTGGRHSYTIAELLHLIERLEEIHTEVQGMISPPHLTTTLIFDVLRRWILYLNMCVAALESESLDALGCHVPFSLDPILADLEGERYVVPILPASLADLLHKTGGRGGGDGSGGGATFKEWKASTTGGDTTVGVRYDAHLPALSLRDGENSHSILVGMVPLDLHGAVLCKKWHLCGVCWEYCKRNARTSLPPPPPHTPEVATTIAGMLKADRGERHAYLQPSGGRPSYPRKPQ